MKERINKLQQQQRQSNPIIDNNNAYRFTSEGYEYVTSLDDNSRRQLQQPQQSKEDQFLKDEEFLKEEYHQQDEEVVAEEKTPRRTIRFDSVDSSLRQTDPSSLSFLRDLAVIGQDDRTKVESTTAYPYKLIGLLDSWCTATVISKTSILTAAHCVYNPGKRRYLVHDESYFSPGAYQDGTRIVEPYGRWSVDYVTVYSQWRDHNNYDYDIAVVELKPRENESSCVFVGDKVGYAGITETYIGNPSLAETSITGYPYKEDGVEMWTSGVCGSGVFEAEGYHYYDYVAYHDCDTSSGMSGAALLDDRARIHGVHSFSLTDSDGIPQHNGAVLIRGPHLDNIVSWSKSGSDSVVSSCNKVQLLSPSFASTGVTSCRCDRFGNALMRRICRRLRRSVC